MFLFADPFPTGDPGHPVDWHNIERHLVGWVAQFSTHSLEAEP